MRNSFYLFFTFLLFAHTPSHAALHGSSSLAFADRFGAGYDYDESTDDLGEENGGTYLRTEIVPNSIEAYARTGVRYWKVEYPHQKVNKYSNAAFQVEALDTYGNTKYEGQGRFDIRPDFQVDVTINEFGSLEAEPDRFAGLYIGDEEGANPHPLGYDAEDTVDEHEAENQLESVFSDFVRENSPALREEVSSLW